MDKISLVILGAGSRGYFTYAKIASQMKDKYRIVAVVEPDDEKRERFIATYHIPEENAFRDWKQLLDKKGKIADVVIIATPDDVHVEPAIAFAKAGYDILLEKPIARRPDELVRIQREIANTGRTVIVAHVLRYTPFFQKIEEIIESGEIGKVKGIDHREQVGFFHFAHSFVRGNWRRSDETAPSILTKSCHDTDIMLWLVGKRIERVAAFGDLLFFNLKNKPKEATDRCVDCPLKETCPYSAVRIYLGDWTGWPVNTITVDLSYEGRLKAIKEGPYGRCVFSCDNDVCDYYAVSIDYEDDIFGTFTLTGLSNEITRVITLFGTHGEVVGDFEKGEIILKRYGGKEEKLEIKAEGGHLGGDEGLMQHLYEVISGQRKPLTALEDSLESHYVAFAIEESRLSGKVISIDSYKEKLFGKY
ncbi:Gfo/Idh/MocA family oxidoreductase [Thermotoga sp.]|uniref:Gfo/Idh/MocA family protein n=1 Tax=Thermotoga sp. TaxID=28240 RepID=UPI0025EA0BB1|nr:Gfo/Idh/MocA family oxidoreductase [Thermotoga sp.]MCD6551579.1 Gfo/Idh/MocA family oxidoreductase [Thermotoga sp.]